MRVTWARKWFLEGSSGKIECAGTKRLEVPLRVGRMSCHVIVYYAPVEGNLHI